MLIAYNRCANGDGHNYMHIYLYYIGNAFFHGRPHPVQIYIPLLAVIWDLAICQFRKRSAKNATMNAFRSF